MPILTAPETVELTGVARRQAIAVANENWFRAVACKAPRDGGPKAELRAANARLAARIVVKHARRDALVNRITNAALAGSSAASAR